MKDWNSLPNLSHIDTLSRTRIKIRSFLEVHYKYSNFIVNSYPHVQPLNMHEVFMSSCNRVHNLKKTILTTHGNDVASRIFYEQGWELGVLVSLMVMTPCFKNIWSSLLCFSLFSSIEQYGRTRNQPRIEEKGRQLGFDEAPIVLPPLGKRGYMRVCGAQGL